MSGSEGIERSTALIAAPAKDDWPLEQPKAKQCKITVEINPGKEGHKVRRSNRYVCKNVQVEVAPSYTSSCFLEEMVPGVLESFQFDTEGVDNYYKPEVANPCCWAKPPYHDYQGEGEGEDLQPRPTRKKKIYAKDRVPQNASQFESEYLSDLITKSRSGACYDLSQLSAEDQLSVLRKVLNTPAEGRNTPSLDLINFTYEKKFIPPPQDQNNRDQVKEYFEKLKNTLQGKSLADQRLSVLLSQYYTSITFWGDEFSPRSALAQGFEEFYRSTVSEGSLGSPLFDSDLDGIYDDKDKRPLVPDQIQKIEQEPKAELEAFDPKDFLQHPLLAKMAVGEIVEIKSHIYRIEPKIALRIIKKQDQTIIEFPIRILPQRPLRDRKAVKEFRENWPKAQAYLEDWMNARLPEGLKFKFVESEEAMEKIVVSSKYPRRSGEDLIFEAEDLDVKNQTILLGRFLRRIAGQTQSGLEEDLEPNLMGQLIYVPGRKILTSQQKEQQKTSNVGQESNLPKKDPEQLFYEGVTTLLDVGQAKHNDDLKLINNLWNAHTFETYLNHRHDQQRKDWKNTVRYQHIFMGYGALHLGAHLHREIAGSGRLAVQETTSGLALNPEVGIMYLAANAKWYEVAYPGISLAYVYRPFFEGKNPQHSHGLKPQAAVAIFDGLGIFQAGPVWIRDKIGGQDHVGLEFSGYFSIPNYHFGVGLAGGVRDLKRAGPEGGWLGISLMVLGAGIKETHQPWEKLRDW